MRRLESLWREHCKAPFPKALTGRNEADFDLITLDTMTAGCIQVWVEQNGRIDLKRVAILQKCHADLDRVVGSLSGESKIYFSRLEEIAQRALAAVVKIE